MIVDRIERMTRGWFIGDFEPSVYRTQDFEVGVLKHHKGEVWPAHYHAIGTEINCLLKGRMIIQGRELVAGDIFVFPPGDVADPVFLEDCEVLCVKTPSIPKDKYEV